MSGLDLLLTAGKGRYLGGDTWIEVYGNHYLPKKARMHLRGEEHRIEFRYDDRGSLEQVTSGRAINLSVHEGWNIPKERQTSPQNGKKKQSVFSRPIYGPQYICGTFLSEPARWEYVYWAEGMISKTGMQLGQISLARIEYSESGKDRITGRQNLSDTMLEIMIPENRSYYRTAQTYPMLLSFI